MKKLMIAACAVAFAAAAHAAAWEWGWMNGASGVYAAGTENQLIGSTAYLFDADAVSQQTVLDTFLAGDALTGYIAGANGTTDDGIVMSDANFDYTATGKTSPDDGKVYLHSYYTIVDGDNIFFSETVETLQANMGEIGIEFDDVTAVSQAAAITTGTYAGAGWYTTAAPEPTSGLLLLLGVAGLALRRRRA